jgi:HD-like signal output (HDOD) protein
MDKQAMMETARQMVAKIDDLPTIPVVATQVLQLLDDPDVNVDKVADLMLTDLVMTARVMKMVNSPIYRASQEITSLKRALVYLGIRHIKEIALTSSFISAFEDKGGVIDISTFWAHSFGVGMVSKIIAEKIRYPDIEKAYLAGIVHDIGEVVLSYYQAESFSKILTIIKERPVRLIDMELEEFGTTHNEIGYCIAENGISRKPTRRWFCTTTARVRPQAIRYCVLLSIWQTCSAQSRSVLRWQRLGQLQPF